MKRIYVVGTADTKGEELGFLAETIRTLGVSVALVDVGIFPPKAAVDVTAAEIAACALSTSCSIPRSRS